MVTPCRASSRTTYHISSKLSASDGNGSWVQGGYATVDASVAYQLDPRASITVSGTNLFDRTYYENLVGPDNNYFGRSRRLLLTVRYKM